MSSDTNSSTVFWNRLLAAVDLLSEQNVPTDEAVACLLAFDEGFADQFDPADHYPEYVTVMLCRAMRRRIELARHEVQQAS